LKRIDPVALYGSLSYSHAYARDVTAPNLFGEARFSGNIAPGDALGYRLGASLAATPDVTLDASLSGALVSGTRVRSDIRGSYDLPRANVSFVNLGGGFLVSRHLSILVNAAAGITRDSPDYILSVTFPYRFQ
jgi:hypothetical protein